MDGGQRAAGGVMRKRVLLMLLPVLAVAVAVPLAIRATRSEAGHVAAVGTTPIQPVQHKVRAAQSVVGSVEDKSITVDGRERTYHVYVPAGYTGETAVPLVLV